MKITIMQIGKTKASYFKEAEQEYLKRLQPYAKVNVITLKETPIHSGDLAERERAKTQEAEEIAKHLDPQSTIIALDEHGKSLNSKQLADHLQKIKDFQGANVTFIIGGPFGLAKNILAQASLILSFSLFTFTHEIIRTLLLEQLYRSFTIQTGKTYHY